MMMMMMMIISKEIQHGDSRLHRCRSEGSKTKRSFHPFGKIGDHSESAATRSTNIWSKEEGGNGSIINIGLSNSPFSCSWQSSLSFLPHSIPAVCAFFVL
jgi:hypothetical protein